MVSRRARCARWLNLSTSPLSAEADVRDHEVCDRLSADEVLLDDALEDGRIAVPVPRALRVDDRDRAAFADAQAVRLRPQNAALLREAELLQPALQVIPRREAALLVAALRLGLIAAEEDVAPAHGDAEAFGDLLLREGHMC